MNLKLYFVIILSILVTGCTSPHYKELYKKKPGFYSYIIGDIQSDWVILPFLITVESRELSCQS